MPHLVRIKRKPDYKSYCAFDHMPIVDNELWYERDARKTYHIGCPPIELEPRFSPKSPAAITYDMKQHQNEYPQKPIQTYRERVQEQEVKTLDVKSYLLPKVTELYDGKFCVPIMYSDGTHGHAVVWMKTMNKDAKYPGSRRVRVHLGRHNGSEFIDAAYITAKGYFNWSKSFASAELEGERRKAAMSAVELVVKGIENSQLAIAYAKLARKCFHCNRDLTAEVTLKHIDETGGLGPYCFKHYPQLANTVLQNKSTNQPIITFRV
jgi:hypothetical protein